MIQIIDAIISLSGGTAQVGIESNNIDTITWQNGTTPIPKADIEAKVVEMQTAYDALQFQRDRTYPDLGEQLDLLFHDMTAGKGSKTGEWYKAVAKVKADNPKG